MLSAIIFIVVLAAAIAFACATKNLKAEGAIVFSVIALLIRLILGEKLFYISASCFALYYILRLLARILKPQKFESTFKSKATGLSQAICYSGLIFPILLIYFLSKSLFEGPSYPFEFACIAFFSSLGASLSIALSLVFEIIFSKSTTSTQAEVEKSKNHPVIASSLLASALACFIIAVLMVLACYNFIGRIIPSLITGVLSGASYIGYVMVFSAMDEKANKRSKVLATKSSLALNSTVKDSQTATNEAVTLKSTDESTTLQEDKPKELNGENNATTNETTELLEQPTNLGTSAKNEDLRLQIAFACNFIAVMISLLVGWIIL